MSARTISGNARCQFQISHDLYIQPCFAHPMCTLGMSIVQPIATLATNLQFSRIFSNFHEVAMLSLDLRECTQEGQYSLYVDISSIYRARFDYRQCSDTVV